MSWYWEAYTELSNSRLRGMGAQPLQHSEIAAYCRLEGFTKGETRLVKYVVLTMDKVWINWANEKSKDGD